MKLLILLVILTTAPDGSVKITRHEMPDMVTCKASAAKVEAINPSLRVGCVHDIGMP